MLLTKHTCAINGLHVVEVDIKSGVAGNTSMDARYATLSKEGDSVVTHGRCTAYHGNWSEETLKLMVAMLASMERDLIPRHFKGSAATEVDDARKGLESGGLEEVDQV
jgi:hypothetical protein